MMETLKTLTALYGPSGSEGDVRAWILKNLQDRNIDAKTDALGNDHVLGSHGNHANAYAPMPRYASIAA